MRKTRDHFNKARTHLIYPVQCVWSKVPYKLKMIAKKHNYQGRLILAICDDGILDKKISDGVVSLDFCSGFFHGKYVEKEELVKLVREAYIINAGGEQTISFLKELGVISSDDVSLVKKTPHCQVVFETRR